jgi:hypothetical protein
VNGSWSKSWRECFLAEEWDVPQLSKSGLMTETKQNNTLRSDQHSKSELMTETKQNKTKQSKTKQYVEK